MLARRVGMYMSKKIIIFLSTLVAAIFLVAAVPAMADHPESQPAPVECPDPDEDGGSCGPDYPIECDLPAPEVEDSCEEDDTESDDSEVEPTTKPPIVLKPRSTEEIPWWKKALQWFFFG